MTIIFGIAHGGANPVSTRYQPIFRWLMYPPSLEHPEIDHFLGRWVWVKMTQIKWLLYCTPPILFG